MALSPRTTAAMMEQDTSDRDVVLITMTHHSWAEPVRLSTDPTQWLYNHEETGEPIFGTVSRGETYLFVPISASLPTSSDESPPEGKIQFANVGRVVTPYLKMVDQQYPRITLEFVNAETPDTVETSWPEMELGSANWDASMAEVGIINNIASSEPMPWLRFVPAYFPNLFD
jgi:Domain of unknown function (DUF1833).